MEQNKGAESWWCALSTGCSSLGEVIVRWHKGFMDAWCGLVRESSYPVMERLLLFSCRQSIHQLSLPNLALNEQHNPRVCAIHTHNKFSLHFSHVTCAVYNVLPSQTIKPQTGDTLTSKFAAEIRPGHFDYRRLSSQPRYHLVKCTWRTEKGRTL